MRKPVDAVAQSRRLEGRDGIWKAITKLKRFTRAQVSAETGIPGKTVRDYVECLVAGGYVEDDGTDERDAQAFKLVRGSISAPRLRPDGTEVTQGRAQEQMWRSMKMLDAFTPKDLAVNASTAEIPVSEVAAKSYVGDLAKAGYLAVVRKSKPGTQAVYRFIQTKNTGPLAPMVQRLKTVFDPNLDRIVWPELGPEPADKVLSSRLTRPA